MVVFFKKITKNKNKNFKKFTKFKKFFLKKIVFFNFKNHKSLKICKFIKTGVIFLKNGNFFKKIIKL